MIKATKIIITLMTLVFLLTTFAVPVIGDEFYVIGYDIKPGSPEETSLNELAGRHGGQYLSAADPSTPQNLESSLNVAFHGNTTPVPTQVSRETDPPEYLSVCETGSETVCGEFFLNGDQYEAFWDNGASAVFTIQQWDTDGVVLYRTDYGDSPGGQYGMYTGQIEGNSISDGYATWTEEGQTWSGTWTAEWDDFWYDDLFWDESLWDEYLQDEGLDQDLY
jgi:hypothetical protein